MAELHVHSEISYPHQGACGACYEAKVCNYCGADIKQDRGRCTNGRCSKCHVTICGPGEAHGFGKAGADWRRAGRR